MKPGVWISEDKDHPGARVILAAYMCGWDGKDDEEPDTDIIALAVMDLFDSPNLTDDEADKLAFRWPGDAEAWLNAQVASAGYRFGWHDGAFYLQTDKWWDQHGGPDEL